MFRDVLISLRHRASAHRHAGFPDILVGLCLTSSLLLVTTLVVQAVVGHTPLPPLETGLATAFILAVSCTALLSQSLNRQTHSTSVAGAESAQASPETSPLPETGVPDHAEPGHGRAVHLLHASKLGHELRTPLTAMRGYADLLLDQYQSQEAFTALTAIKRNANHLLAVINDQLDLSKAHAGQLTIERIPVDARQIVRDVIDTLLICVHDKPVRLLSDVAPDVPDRIATDPTRLRQILNNLVSNAVKFTPQGTIYIRVRTTSFNALPHLEFAVADSGIGLTETELQSLFRPFSQANASTTRRFGGSGLGLVLSRELARLLGGDLTLASRPGEGTTATFTIAAPLAVCDAARPVEQTPSQQVDLTGLRVLVVEDSEDNSRLIGHFLRKAGAGFVIACDGQAACDEALSAEATSRPFDVILMDLDLPVLDGCQATARLIDAGYPRPIVMLTAHSEADIGERCRAAGAVAIASKPLEPRKLLQMILDLSERHGESDDSEPVDFCLLDALR